VLRSLYGNEHEAFRQTVRTFLAKEVVDELSNWEKQGQPADSYWLRLGELGILGIQVDERFGGGGQSSFKFNAVLTEEHCRARADLGGLRVHMDIVLPYLTHYCTEEQKERWLPGIASGKLITAIAMTEPGTGSDLAGIRTVATLDGDEYLLNGAKTFISNGACANLVLVVARTSPDHTDNRRDGLSILVVETDTPGFSVGRKLDKLGLKAQDTTELFFDNVRVPARNLLGEPGNAFEYLMHNLAQERLSIAIACLGSASKALDITIPYVQDRMIFGHSLATFQNTKFELAQCAAEIEMGQVFVDKALEEHDAGRLDGADAAKAKLLCSEMLGRVTDRCLQLHGGYGYMLDYPISKMYADARIMRIAGGSSEVLKSIISKSIGL
jgi:alkylation response protein AidB-like acyl-CoA dehydrogenase